MNVSNLTKGRALLLGLAIAICGWLLIPHIGKEVVFEQLSPGFIHNRFVIEATTWPLKKDQALSQRMWIPNRHISAIEFVIDCPSSNDSLPFLTLYTDGEIMPADSFYRSQASLLTRSETCVLHYEVPIVLNKPQTWIWATLVLAPASDPILFFREQSVANYPGGDLLLLPAQKHITSILAFRLLSQTKEWDVTWQRLLAMLAVVVLLTFIVESRRT